MMPADQAKASGISATYLPVFVTLASPRARQVAHANTDLHACSQ